MPSVYDIKPRLQALVRPLARGMAGAGVRANQVSVAAMLVSVAVGQFLGLAGGARRGIWWQLPAWLLPAPGVHGDRWIDALAWVLTALCALTVLHRARHALREVHG